jgi:hypothetical protein
MALAILLMALYSWLRTTFLMALAIIFMALATFLMILAIIFKALTTFFIGATFLMALATWL